MLSLLAYSLITLGPEIDEHRQTGRLETTLQCSARIWQNWWTSLCHQILLQLLQQRLRIKRDTERRGDSTRLFLST